MKQLKLSYGETTATIDPTGAWLTSLADKKGDILYQRHLITDVNGAEKVRGGMHVCLPNFGPDEQTGQPQHGFGRSSQWRVVGNDDAYASMILLNGTGIYEDVSSMLSFELDEKQLTVTLSVINKGTEPVHIAPGFHPYFAIDPKNVYLDDDPVNLNQLIDTKFISGQAHDIETTNRVITVDSEELNHWAVWTDMLDNYLCVEPTLSGYAFTREPVPENEMLGNRAQGTYSVTISWT